MNQKKTKPRDQDSSVVCDHCGGIARGGGYGGFDKDNKFRAFCSPECRTAFCKADHGIADAETGQVTLGKFEAKA